MKTPTLLAQLVTAAVLSAPLSVLGSSNSETVQALKLTHFVEPVFPATVVHEGVAEGNVILAVSRNAVGEPVDILVLRATNPRLAVAAVEAVRQWRFAVEGNADLSPKLIQLGFKLQGVIIFPYGKNLTEEMASQTAALESRTSLVPHLQTLSRVPKALEQPMPQYPAALTDKGLNGTAAVSFFVDEEGRVRLPKVDEATAPEFAEAALAAVSQWRYEPPRSGSRTVVARDHWEFRFQGTN